MSVKPTADPVGEVVHNSDLDRFIETMKSTLDFSNINVTWRFWKKFRLTPVTTFLLKCLDDLITYVDQVIDASGPDKKATVLWAMGEVYDYVAKQAMPVWLKPFAGAVRAYVIGVLISVAIDWIVSKYRHGDWRPTPPLDIESEWANLHSQMFGVPFNDHRPTL